MTHAKKEWEKDHKSSLEKYEATVTDLSKKIRELQEENYQEQESINAEVDISIDHQTKISGLIEEVGEAQKKVIMLTLF